VGINENDFKLLGNRGATSKIREFEDL